MYFLYLSTFCAKVVGATSSEIFLVRYQCSALKIKIYFRKTITRTALRVFSTLFSEMSR